MPVHVGSPVKSVVTGATGFIGHHLVKTLHQRGDKVIGIDNLAGGVFEERFVTGVEYSHYDIANPVNDKRLADDCEGVDYVFHLAALPRVQKSIEDPVGTAFANVVGTVAILHAASKAGAEKLVFASSSSVYGESKELPLHENMPASPMSPYALDKKQGEEWCQHFSLFYNLPTVCLRFFNVYGQGADPNGAYALVVAKFLEQKRRGEPLTITGDGEQTRDFTHVRDVVRAMLLAAEHPDVSMGKVINIGGGRQIPINAVANLIDPRGTHEYIDERPEPRHTLASIENAKRILGWHPEIKFEDGVRELLVLNH